MVDEETMVQQGVAEVVGVQTTDASSISETMDTIAHRESTLAELDGIARQLRRDIVTMIGAAGSGHPGGSLSSVEILTALYWRVLRHDSSNPSWPDRDRFILSKGHVAPVLYAALAEAGYFSKDLLMTLRKFGSPLQGHTDSTALPGVEMSGGSLGQGLSFGIGTAKAGRLDNKDYRVYVLLGDGECQEGQVWEAAMAAGKYKLDTLTAIVDRNGIQNDDRVEVQMHVEPLADKWRAFGWHVIEADGHSIPSLLSGIDAAMTTKGQPSVIIAHTIKGKGVSFMEDNVEFHGKAPTAEQVEQALAELAD
ncbi:MAG: transketolase subunit [Dehalococcoidia bacterium]|nr:transketolase subunit [Dehalococcoidia bacterium]